MLDLYATGASLHDAVDLCQRLIQIFYRGPIAHLSVAELMRKDLQIDLIDDPLAIEKLRQALITRYGQPGAQISTLFDRYSADVIEPLSKGRCLIVTDFPCAVEPRAMPLAGPASVAARAEFQIDGMEIAHLYQDDANTKNFVRRAREQGTYGAEDEIVCRLIDEKEFDGRSAGFGLGVERLCQVSLGLPDIYPFMVSREFIREHSPRLSLEIAVALAVE